MGYKLPKPWIWVPPKKDKNNTQYKKKKGKGFGDTQKKQEDVDDRPSDSAFGHAGGASDKDETKFRIFCQKKPDLEKYLYVRELSDSYQTRLPTHPLENGMVKHDHKILEPIRYTARCYVKSYMMQSAGISGGPDEQAQDICKKCAKLLDELVESKDLNEFIEIESPMEYESPELYLVSYEKRTEPDKTDVFSFTLNLQEILRSTSEKKATDNPDFASNSNKGGKGG